MWETPGWAREELAGPRSTQPWPGRAAPTRVAGTPPPTAAVPRAVEPRAEFLEVAAEGSSRAELRPGGAPRPTQEARAASRHLPASCTTVFSGQTPRASRFRPTGAASS